MYIIVKSGVYMSGVCGLFESKEDAIHACNKLADEDVDNYHSWNVFEVNFGVPCQKDDCDDNDGAIYTTRKGKTKKNIKEN